MGSFHPHLFWGDISSWNDSRFWVSRKHRSVEQKPNTEVPGISTQDPRGALPGALRIFAFLFFPLKQPEVHLHSWSIFSASYISLPERTLPETNIFAPEKWMVGILVLLLFLLGGMAYIFRCYCWWTKSCTTNDDDDPIIYKFFFNHPRWLAGFPPSTADGKNPLSHRIQVETMEKRMEKRELGIWQKIMAAKTLSLCFFHTEPKTHTQIWINK